MRYLDGLVGSVHVVLGRERIAKNDLRINRPILCGFFDLQILDILNVRSNLWMSCRVGIIRLVEYHIILSRRTCLVSDLNLQVVPLARLQFTVGKLIPCGIKTGYTTVCPVACRNVLSLVVNIHCLTQERIFKCIELKGEFQIVIITDIVLDLELHTGGGPLGITVVIVRHFDSLIGSIHVVLGRERIAKNNLRINRPILCGFFAFQILDILNVCSNLGMTCRVGVIRLVEYHIILSRCTCLVSNLNLQVVPLARLQFTVGKLIPCGIKTGYTTVCPVACGNILPLVVNIH